MIARSRPYIWVTPGHYISPGQPGHYLSYSVLKLDIGGDGKTSGKLGSNLQPLLIDSSSSTMNDPSSASQAPPPRYLLESDSSDEEGQGAYPSTSRKPARARPTHDVSVQFIDQVGDVGCIAVSVGQAGRYLDRMTGARKAIGEVTSLGEVVGRALRVDGDLLLVMEEGEQSEGIYAVADKIVQTVKARSWCVKGCQSISELTFPRLVVSTYLPSMYIPDPSSQPSISSTPPIRHLRTSGSTPSSGSVAAFDSPNYVTGLPAALESIVSHTSVRST